MKSVSACCSLETGSLVLGVISSVISCVAILISLLAMASISYELKMIASDTDVYVTKVSQSLSLLFFIVLFLMSAINLLFSSFLCQGVQKRNAAYVMAYFVYGVVLMSLSVIITLVMEYVIEFDETVSPYLLTIDGVYILLHSLLLIMVHKTYQKLCAGGVYQFEHRILNES